MPTKSALNEKVARHICESRGADPDQPLTIGRPDGTSERFDYAWRGYVALADEIIKLVKLES